MTTITIPNIGTDEAVEIIEILVKKGDNLSKDETILVLESDKASMEIPSPDDGVITDIKVSVGDKVKEGDLIGEMDIAAGTGGSDSLDKSTTATTAIESAAESNPATAPAKATTPSEPSKKEQAPTKMETAQPAAANSSSNDIYAGPAVRKLSRELDIDLGVIQASGDKGRITKDDLHDYIKRGLSGAGGSPMGGSMGGALPPEPSVDFAAFGKIEVVPMDKIGKLTAAAMQSSKLNAPHVTQFDEADVTDLENFRKLQKEVAANKGIKLTPVPFLLKALALTLEEFPQFNVSLKGSNIIRKHYYHVGMAVDTPYGLVVPVIRDVNTKSIFELADEVTSVSEAARNRKLKPVDMQGGCITLSSLGAGGGTQFTPIINLPEVAILGVSRLIKKPVYQGDQLLPRLMMPLALSYDHRAVNGVDGAKFVRHLAALLADVRKLAI